MADLEPVPVWVDGIYVKAGLEKDKAALLVVLAALRDGRKVIVAVESGHRESTDSWAAVLRDLRRRGFRAPRLVIGDGHLGIWGALATVDPTAAEQRCWNHRLMNVLDKLPLYPVYFTYTLHLYPALFHLYPVLTGVNVGESFAVSPGELVIGRGDTCDVQVLDDGASRRHALLRIEGNEASLEDLSSRNGTFVNGRRIDRQRLHDGDKIQVGSTTILKLTFQDEVDETFQRRMFESALRDPLTRAFNKRYFMGSPALHERREIAVGRRDDAHMLTGQRRS